MLDLITDYKTKYIMEQIMKGDTDNLSPEINRINLCFRLCGKKVSMEAKKCSPERHIVRMFKVLFVANVILAEDLLPLVTYMYLWHTRKSLWKQAKKEISNESTFANSIGKDRFKMCMNIYRSCYPVLKHKDYSNIDFDNVLLTMLDVLDYSSIEGCQILSDFSRGEYFETLVRKKASTFYSFRGGLYPAQKPVKEDSYADK